MDEQPEVTLEDRVVANTYTIAAVIHVLEQKGLIARNEIMDILQQLQNQSDEEI